MKEPKWLMAESVLAMHARQLAEHGGAEGIRDNGLFESALNRPLNNYHYAEEKDLFKIAAGYAFGIIKNHPFIDGNKRAGFMACAVFLLKNGFELDASEEEAYIATIKLAEGSYSEHDFAEWLKSNSIKS